MDGFLFGSNVMPELEHRGKKVGERLSENINVIANEPSLAFYRIQEHVRKSLPQLVDKKHEVQQVQQEIQGACFDMEYGINAVQAMEGSRTHFQNIQELLKNAMFMKQQIQYESRSEDPDPEQQQQQRSHHSMYRSMTRTNTVDIPVSAHAGPSADFTQSLQVTQWSRDEQRGRSSSMSDHRGRPSQTNK